jgi:Spy/CpxP family protein refolding chaperone
MSWSTTVLSGLLAGIILSAALANNATAQVPIRTGPHTASGPSAKPARVEPCWEVAGVSKSAMQQRRAITQQARQEVEAVCANSSLSMQQQRQQIQQIHQRERQQIDGIITPAQQEAMRSCQQERNAGRGGGHVGGGHGGPCGEMSVGHKPNPQQEEETPPNEAPKPN